MRLKKKIQKVYNEEDNLSHKTTPKEHSPLTLDNSLVTKLNYSKLPLDGNAKIGVFFFP
jgi:hypothetical protein